MTSEASLSTTRASRTSAPLCEVFCSFQGEGPGVGLPTAFVRAAGCPLRCSYCDSVFSYEAPPGSNVRDFDGAVLAEFENPARGPEIVDLLARSAHFAGIAELSFTGGEPLLWPGFGAELFEAAQFAGLRTHLETAALDARALERLLPWLDHLAMDWKLPSTVQGQDLGPKHLECLEDALVAGKDVSVKIVLVARDDGTELERAFEQLSEISGHFELVLQPVTPCLHETTPLGRDALLRAATLAFAYGFTPRVLPQVHKLLGFD